MAADTTACTGFHQLKVKVWLSSGVEIELILCCGPRFGADAHNSNADPGHPAGFRIDHEGCGRECDPVGDAAADLMQAGDPRLTGERRRQRVQAELDEQ